MNASAPRISHLVAGLAGLLWCLGAAAAAPDAALKAAVAQSGAQPEFRGARQGAPSGRGTGIFRHQADMTVVELWPGGGYWTEILGPYLAKERNLLRRARAPGQHRGRQSVNAKWHTRIAARRARSARSTRRPWEPAISTSHPRAPPTSCSRSATCITGWTAAMPSRRWPRASRRSSPAASSASKSTADRNDKPQDPKAADGYVREDYAIALAKKAGFVLVGSSEINANPKDTKDWVDGVWTLPPTLVSGR